MEQAAGDDVVEVGPWLNRAGWAAMMAGETALLLTLSRRRAERRRSMPTRARLSLVFATSSVVAGLLYWSQADWWAYVEFFEGPTPKFTMPWWWQAIESGVAGCAAGSLVTLTWAGARRVPPRNRA
jgi:hypothetical protein